MGREHEQIDRICCAFYEENEKKTIHLTWNGRYETKKKDKKKIKLKNKYQI